ncbi:MAG: hypothetical protein ACRYG5_06190 [Janthinobacterium lividum]
MAPNDKDDDADGSASTSAFAPTSASTSAPAATAPAPAPTFNELTSALDRMKALVTQDTSAIEQLFTQHLSTLQDLPGLAELSASFSAASAHGPAAAALPVDLSPMPELVNTRVPARSNAHGAATQTDWAYARRALLRYAKRV